MSTKFTKIDEQEDIEESLGQALINANQWISASLLNLMSDRGHDDLTGAHLTFFCSLNCGLTHASEVARRMGITRQAVYKVTKELQGMGILNLEEDSSDRRQKVICMTQRGERIALDARASLEEIEKRLSIQIGKSSFDSLQKTLLKNWGPAIKSQGG